MPEHGDEKNQLCPQRWLEKVLGINFLENQREFNRNFKIWSSGDNNIGKSLPSF